MKLSTTAEGIFFFNGHCKDSRIAKAIALTETQKLIKNVILNDFDFDKRNVKRYVKAIEIAKAIKIDKVRIG